MAASKKVHGFLFMSRSLDRSYVLNMPTIAEAGELQVISYINNYILEVGQPITIKIGKFVFKNIYGANKIPGTPKADISLVSYDIGLKKFKEVCFISHKAGKDASSFQQYSGISVQADGKKPGSISKNSEIIDFLKAISQPVIYDEIVNGKKRFYSIIDDPVLVSRAIFGPDFGTGKYSKNNANLIGQGTVKILPIGVYHVLSFSAHGMMNPNVRDFMIGNYTLSVCARYGSKESFKVDGKTYRFVRVILMPKAGIGKNANEIKHGNI